MDERTPARPDITLTIDREGVIRSALCAEALAGESVDHWAGRAWGETVSPEVVREVARIVDRAQAEGGSSCFQLNQRFPSGREFPIEYTTISLGGNAGFIAVGKNLQTVADLQKRLRSAQAEREQDYWKLREVETRYRALLDASDEAVVLVRSSNLRVVEANAAAARALGLVPGAEFQPVMAPRDKSAFGAMLETARSQGRAPAIALHLSSDGAPWSLKASLINTAAGSFYLLQLAPLERRPQAQEPAERLCVEGLMRRMPDAFVVADALGNVRWANDTFLDLAQLGVESGAIGQNLKRWLSKPGADAAFVLSMVQRHGGVRALRTTIEGDLGTGVEVEISAVGDKADHAGQVGVLLRDVTRRAMVQGADEASGPTADPFAGGASLEEVVRASVDAIERRAVNDALGKANGNRTRAAKALGLSRQSLHAKLNKFRLTRA